MAIYNIWTIAVVALLCSGFVGLVLRKSGVAILAASIGLLIIASGMTLLSFYYLPPGTMTPQFSHLLSAFGFVILPVAAAAALAADTGSPRSSLLRASQAGLLAFVLGPLSIHIGMYLHIMLTGDGP